MGVKLWDVAWRSYSAGPSPFDNLRTEYYLKGCDKALQGNPCDGCFNPDLWDNTAEKKVNTDLIIHTASQYAPTKYVSIGGGEPTDQLNGLIDLCHAFQDAGYHVLVYTWRSLMNHLHDLKGLIHCTDMIIDGPYKKGQRIYDATKQDGFLNSIGSSNQVIWDTSLAGTGTVIGYRAGDLKGLTLQEKLIFHTKGGAKEKKIAV